ncbi:MAG: hypothetical protein WA652_13670 [Xanthobacteraceae bacterium]
MNHASGEAINPQRPITADAIILISLPLLGHTPDMTGPAAGLILVAIDPYGVLGCGEISQGADEEKETAGIYAARMGGCYVRYRSVAPPM